jgi:hypothetical protein
MQDKYIDDYGLKNKKETVFMNNYEFTNCGVVENKEAELYGS